MNAQTFLIKKDEVDEDLLHDKSTYSFAKTPWSYN